MKTIYFYILALLLIPATALSTDTTGLSELIITTPELASMVTEVLSLQPDTSMENGYLE